MIAGGKAVVVSRRPLINAVSHGQGSCRGRRGWLIGLIPEALARRAPLESASSSGQMAFGPASSQTGWRAVWTPVAEADRPHPASRLIR